jgi:glycine cleavage system H protein
VIIGNCRFADDVLYDTASSTWVRFEEDGTATVGITAVLAWLGGPVSSVSFKPVGAVVGRGKSLGAIESPRHFDTVRSPITGKVIEMNPALAGNPRMLNRDPYGSGWFAKLEPLKKQDEVGMVKPPGLARGELEARIAELKIRCFAEFPDNEMYEIGTECSAVLVRLDELLTTSPTGTVVHLVSDDPSSEIEMIRWTERTGNQLLEARREGNLVHYLVKKTQP